MLTLDQTTAAATCDLPELIFNLHWAWDAETMRLFERIAPEAWEQSHQNPVALLTEPQLTQTIDTLNRDPSLRAEVELQRNRLRQYLERPLQRAPRVGYFSAEFGLAECLPIYSGGLGVLAGDHLKGASDIGLPLTGVGLFYYQGYFRQFVGWDGRQSEEYSTLDPDNLPLEPVRNAAGDILKFSIEFPIRQVWFQVWKAQVGRVPLYLLDTNVPENDPADRQITARLYGGDNDMRMRQEIILGRGGVQALELMGETIDVFHMNEGHAGFLALERARIAMRQQGCSFAEACRQVRNQLVFTTHTAGSRAGSTTSTRRPSSCTLTSTVGSWASEPRDPGARSREPEGHRLLVQHGRAWLATGQSEQRCEQAASEGLDEALGRPLRRPKHAARADPGDYQRGSHRDLDGPGDGLRSWMATLIRSGDAIPSGPPTGTACKTSRPRSSGTFARSSAAD